MQDIRHDSSYPLLCWTLPSHGPRPLQAKGLPQPPQGQGTVQLVVKPRRFQRVRHNRELARDPFDVPKPS